MRWKRAHCYCGIHHMSHVLLNLYLFSNTMDLVIANICKICLSNSKYVKITGDNTRQNTVEYISSENAFLTFCISLIVVHIAAK